MLNLNNPPNVAIQIACDLHGQDPGQMMGDDQTRALEVAANWGREEFIDTMITLLPLHLRETACECWDRLN